MNTYNIAAIGGDGIGPEVVKAGVQVLNVCAERDGGFKIDFKNFDWGSDYYKKHGVMMPADGADQLRKFDAILFGAVGAPDIPDHITLWGLRLAICQPLDQYANVRPTRILPGIISPLRNVSGPELDWVIVRENSEGEYSGVGGRVHKGLPEEAGMDVSLMTRPGVTRIMRFAFRLAQSRPRKLLTVVTKSNAQRHAMVMWDELAAEVAKEFPDVTWDKLTMQMVMRPQTLDTIVATNLHADILSDLAAALAGSLGIAPTANLNPERKAPSMFEPIHGSAFDITGKGVANPVATFWTASMMLAHLGEKGAAARLMKAVERVTANKALHTPDLGGKGPRGRSQTRSARFSAPPTIRGVRPGFRGIRWCITHASYSEACSMQRLPLHRRSCASPTISLPRRRAEPSWSAPVRPRPQWPRPSRMPGPAP